MFLDVFVNSEIHTRIRVSFAEIIILKKCFELEKREELNLTQKKGLYYLGVLLS